MAEYKKGQRIPLANGSNAEIIGKLGEGGQGTVYRVKQYRKGCADESVPLAAVHNKAF